MQNKKKLIKVGILLGLVLAIGLTVLYASSIAPTNFKLKYQSYIHSTIPRGFDGFKIGLISDFDLKSEEDLDYLEKCITKVNQENCDMIVFAGDLYEGNIFSQERLISILKKLTNVNGKLAVLGENELKSNTDNCIQILEESGFEVLRNDCHYIYSKNSRIVFAGLENSTEISSLLTEDMQSQFILAAIHQPDYFKDLKATEALLQLSGHSGGGFISIPYFGGLVKIDGAKTYHQSKITSLSSSLIVSNGIGMGHDQNTRFNCDPNAVIITLKAPS